MSNFIVEYLDGKMEIIEADDFSLTAIPGWVVFEKNGQQVETLSAGAMRRPPQPVPIHRPQRKRAE